MLRTLLTPLIAISLLFTVAACSTPTASAEVPAAVPAVTESTIVLDVRTPEEFAEGHLEGAVLLNLESGEFATTLPQLDTDAEYLVYCRSGNRSGQAVEMMEEFGMDNVTDLGSLEEASRITGLDIVTP